MRSRILALSALPLLLAALASCGSDEEKASPTCTYTADGDASKEVELPPGEPKTVDSLTIKTNRGDITATFRSKETPCTVSSFASLAEQGYFDDTTCHRLVPGFVLQCGDPLATGMGGPGYAFPDELSGDETYPAGTLAMANSGADTNGSQFFVVLGEADLPPEFTVFGTIDAAGLKVAQDIEKDGNAPDGVAPAEDVVIESVS